MAKTDKQYDLIVIGSGIAGTQSALIAANSGLSVAIIEEDKLGGNSANYSDIPMSVLAKATSSLINTKKSYIYGLRTNNIAYNFSLIKDFEFKAIKNSLVNTEDFYTSFGIDVIKGHAHFINPETISVNKKHFQANKFLIATGAKWKTPNINGIKENLFKTPKDILTINRPPKSVFIVGGNETAIELAQALSTFGSKVFLTEMSSRLLPKFDQEVGDYVENILSNNHKVIISTSSRVLSVVKEGLSKRIRFSHAGVEREVKVDEIFFADELEPNLDLGLTNASVEYTKQGIITDNHLKTSNRNIYAAGDVLGVHSSAHSASIEAKIALSNILGLSKHSVDYLSIPIVVNFSPEIAKIGLTEDDCEKRSIKYRSIITNFSECPIANIETNIEGFIKLIINNKKEIIGAVVVGPEAKSIISALAIAIKTKMNIQSLANIPQPFLSYSEIITIAANKF